VFLKKTISLQWLLRQTFVALQYKNTMAVIITVGHISDSSKDISDGYLPNNIPTLTMVRQEEGVAENKENKKEKNVQDLYDNQ
jgi:hypothetical protein